MTDMTMAVDTSAVAKKDPARRLVDSEPFRVTV